MGATTASSVSKPAVSGSAVGSSSGLGSSLATVLKNSESGWSNLGKEVNALTNSISNNFDLGNISQSIDKFIDAVSIEDEPPFSNVLHNYASYSYIFTLSAIDQYRLNYPNETYKQGDLGQIILKSGSGRPNERVFIDGIGLLEFYIDDVNIKSVISFDRTTGNTNATGISFKIIEPYSMGMFFHALQTSARLMGFKNYTLAPYLLTLEFIGHISPGTQGISGDSLSSVEKTTRHFPIRFQLLEMEVNAAGATYDVKAIPINHHAFSTTYMKIKSDISISGKTVHELLQTGKKSLQKVLNDRLIEEGKNNNKVPDQILISFPIDPSSGQSSKKQGDANENSTPRATVNPAETSASKLSVYDKLRVSVKENGNGTLVQDIEDINPFGRASMSFDAYKQGDTPFAKDDVVYDSKKHVYTRGNVTIDPNEGDMKFPQSADIVDIINQVIQMSDYGRQALKKEQISPAGKLSWWRVDPQVYSIPTDQNDNITGQPPQLIVYRVIPYKTDVSNFLPPGKGNPYIEEAKKQALREYNYIYTGENLDIINFEIKFRASMYQALHANVGNNSGDQVQTEQRSNLSESPNQKHDPQQDQIAKQLFNIDDLPDTENEIIIPTKTDQTESSGTGKGGGSLNTNETLLTKQAHDIILNGTDMISPAMEIWGDPFYIADSGMGNFSSKQVKKLDNINADHSMNYQSSEIDIVVNFRSPVDIDGASGTYKFGNTRIIDQFSGLYQVRRCESLFAKGRFTQTLSLTRRPGQNGTKK